MKQYANVTIIMIKHVISLCTYSLILVWKSPLFPRTVALATRCHLVQASLGSFPTSEQQLWKEKKIQLLRIKNSGGKSSAKRCSLTFETVETNLCMQSRHLRIKPLKNGMLYSFLFPSDCHLTSWFAFPEHNSLRSHRNQQTHYFHYTCRWSFAWNGFINK